MTHFLSFDLEGLPTPLHIAPDLPDLPYPVVLIPQGTLTKVEKSRSPPVLPLPTTPTAPHTFEAYCRRLPLWEQQLRSYIHPLDASISLSECLAQGIPLYLCSDGGALKHVGSIGWAIATETELLWDCTGSAYGWHANSFRSEGLSHLSLLTFLNRFILYHQIKVFSPEPILDTALPRRRPLLRAATDNQGLLQRIAQAMHRLSSPFPTDGLRAEYDVIAAITEIVTALPCALHWEHVTGHQDKVIPQDQLTRMEKLNIHADAQATLGLDISLPQRTSYFITPSIPELRVNSTTITSHYATQL
jgi:hypothetical protein